jgi:putative DNA primase/helicase
MLLALEPPARVKVITLPDLPPKGDIVEFVEARGAAGVSARDIRAEIEAIAEATPWASVSSVSSVGASSGGHAEPWPDPEPLPEELPPVEKFDPGLLPESLRSWAVDIAERTQCPIDYVAVGLMVGMSSVVGRTVGVRPKRFDDWTVVPNLWGGVVGRPGVMKSPALQESLKPLRRMDLEAKREHDDLAREIVAKQEIAEAKRRVQKQKIKKAVEKGEDPHRLAMESIQDGGDGELIRKRYIVNDSSVEKLGEILNENPRGVLVFRDELVGLLKSLDKEGQEGARGFYLQAWNGDGSYIYDRIGRGTIDIEAAVVSVLGGIQPGPLSCYLRAAAKGGADDDGLVQRFQLLVWPDVSRAWVNVDRFPDSGARRRVFDVFAGLDALEPDLVGADNDPMEPDGIPFLRFDEAAQAVFDEWREHWEPKVRSGELAPVLEAHLSKYRSLVPSIALLGHLADGGRGAVGLAHLLKALEWADYLESHAKRIYSQSMNPDLVAARSLAKHILGGDVKDGFALRELYRKGWSGLSSAEDAKDGAAYLIDLGWLREGRVQTEGRTGTVYLVNPKVSDLKTSDGPGEGTDRTDRSAPDTPSVSSVGRDQGAPDENRSDEGEPE